MIRVDHRIALELGLGMSAPLMDFADIASSELELKRRSKFDSTLPFFPLLRPPIDDDAHNS